jgi:hypothetical protein
MKQAAMILVVCGLLVNRDANALEAAGTSFAKSTRLGDHKLLWKGAEARVAPPLNTYAAAPCRGAPSQTTDGALRQGRGTRIELKVSCCLGGEPILCSRREAMTANLNRPQTNAVPAKPEARTERFDGVQPVDGGDIVVLEHVPASGKEIMVSVVRDGTLPREEFGQALSKVRWKTTPFSLRSRKRG